MDIGGGIDRITPFDSTFSRWIENRYVLYAVIIVVLLILTIVFIPHMVGTFLVFGFTGYLLWYNYMGVKK